MGKIYFSPPNKKLIQIQCKNKKGWRKNLWFMYVRLRKIKMLKKVHNPHSAGNKRVDCQLCLIHRDLIRGWGSVGEMMEFVTFPSTLKLNNCAISVPLKTDGKLDCRWYYPIAIFYSPLPPPPGWATLSKCMCTVRSGPGIRWNSVHICTSGASTMKAHLFPSRSTNQSVTQLTANDSGMAIRWRNTQLRLRIWNCWFGFNTW